MLKSCRSVHALSGSMIELETAIRQHSADELVQYKKIDSQSLYLGFYWPRGERAELLPAILLIHGGGWQSKKVFVDQRLWAGDYLGFLARYLANQGYVCVSIDYRLARNNAQAEGFQLIDLYEDCLEAAEYVTLHAQRYGIDRNRILLLGESAGGQLAGALATFKDAQYLHICGAILVNPITDFVNDEYWQTYIPKSSTHLALKPLTFAQRCVYLSPLWRIDRDTCPIVLLHGTDDNTVLPEHSIRAYEAMRQAQRPCQLHLLEKTNHAFLLAEYTDNPAACSLGIQIISCALKQMLPD